MEKTPDSTTKKKTSYKVLSGIGIALCVVFGAVLVMNTVMIIKSYLHPDEVPSVGGTMPEIVLTESMEPVIKAGDIIIAKKTTPEEIRPGDIISFFDPASKGSAVVTHRAMGIVHKEAPNVYTLTTVTEEGEELVINGVYSTQVFSVTFEDSEHGIRYAFDTEKTKSMKESEENYFFLTMGDNNGVQDRSPVPFSNLVGRYSGTRFPGLGRVAMFMQTTPGLIVCVMIPLVLFVGYDMLRRRFVDKKKEKEDSDLLAELEALRAAKAAEEGKTSDNVPPSEGQ